MAKILQSPWTVSLLAMLLYAGSTLYFWQSPNLPRRVAVQALDHSTTAAQPIVDHGPSWDFTNPEVDQLVKELRQERAAMAERAKQLDELSERLKVEQAELQNATQAVHQLQRDFDLSIVRVKEDETVNLKRLAKVYSAMEPDGATLILKELDEITVVKVLSFMKEDQIAALLTSLARSGGEESKRVAAISERLRLIQARPANSKTKP